MRTTIGFAALTLALTIPAVWCAAEEKAPVSANDLAKAFAEAGKPGPGHARLQPLAGSWTYTCKMWMEPGGPPIETRGEIERNWILGGRFLATKIAGTGFDGKPGFEAFGLLGYDTAEEKYTSTWACNMGTGASTGVGIAEHAGGFTFQTECSCPLLKTKIKGREVIRLESSDRIVTESYHTIDGKELKAMEIVAVRKK